MMSSPEPSSPPSSGPRRLSVSRLGAALGAVVGVVTIVGTTLGAVTAWPDNWWPRHPPEPEIYIKSVGNSGNLAVPLTVKALDKQLSRAKYTCTESTANLLESVGGVPHHVFIDFVLTTERSESVVILGLEPHVRRVPQPVLRTEVLDCPGGDGYFGRQASLVVDARPPRFRLFDESGPIERVGINMGKGDAADFHIEATAARSGAAYEWTVDLKVLVGGKPRNLAVSDNGEPFKVAAPLPKRAPRVDLSKKLKDGYAFCSERPRDPLC